MLMLLLLEINWSQPEMLAQEFVSSFYPDSLIIKSIQDLQCYKKSQQICIAGNGSSAFFYADAMDSANTDFDLSGTSAIALQNRIVQFYFYEPHFLLNGPSHKLSSPESISAYALHRILHHEWTIAASSSRCSVVVPNPQIPSNPYGYAEVVDHANIVIPPWYFVNESTDHLILNGLRDFFASTLCHTHILNFRGSIIRQLSLAFALGYQHIAISGIDPSLQGFWYTIPRLRQLYLDKLVRSRIESTLSSYEISHKLCALVSPDEHCLYENIETYFQFTKSILLALRLFCSAFPGTSVSLLVCDKIVDSIASELLLHKVKNLCIDKCEQIEA